MESARRDAEESRPPTAEPLPPPPKTVPTPPAKPELRPSLSSSIPPGLEELSAEEREKIMAVMATAAEEERGSALAISPLPPMLQTSSPVTEIPPSSESPVPIVTSPSSSPEPIVRTPSDHSIDEAPEADVITVERRAAAMYDGESSVLAAETLIRSSSGDQAIERAAAVYDGESSVMAAETLIRSSSGDQAIEFFGAVQERRTSEVIVAKREEPTAEEFLDESVEEDLPGVDLSHLSPSEREQIRAVMRMAQMDDPGRREASHRRPYSKPGSPPKSDGAADRKTRQISMTSSSELGSPTRESGYGTTSTSYDNELGDFATKTERMYDVLEDADEVRDGAHSRNDSRADDRRDDFDFTFSDARFSEISDENFDQDKYKVSLHDDSGVNVDAVEMSDAPYGHERPEWSGGRTRMWTTVFEGDESEQPSDDVFLRSPTEPDDGTDYSLNEIEFDTGVVPSSKVAPPPTRAAATAWTPMGIETPVKRATPEITVTVHDEKVDSEDDEYPDKVVAAPVAPTPTYEEVEQERQLQEQYGKEVLQQIQAFGEAADDEFDVQWAKSTLQRSQKTHDKHDTPLELSKDEERRNPFLESPEDEDVNGFLVEIRQSTDSESFIFRGPVRHQFIGHKAI
ncbi:unnamed protein product [Heligmosomoides polygyrus]|uniref:PH domain-containing protein n=1 Tax=Heligmosomoides polygyrus TaxID=6339 RepID=A0A183F3L2_HELPZ|nr:unnamed protein product [Heligmosomoides polygyrus]